MTATRNAVPSRNDLLTRNHSSVATQTPARNIRRTVLPNGLLVLTESIPHVRSVSMGVWTRSGSRDEPLELNGISHFVEHMVFKGTTTRDAQPAKSTRLAAIWTRLPARKTSASTSRCWTSTSSQRWIC